MDTWEIKDIRHYIFLADEAMMKTKKLEKKSHAKGSFVIKNDRGLHTRPSTEIVKCAASFRSDVRLIYHKTEVNAKSLLGILMLAATKGARIQVIADGDDAEEAVISLIDLAKKQFNITY